MPTRARLCLRRRATSRSTCGRSATRAIHGGGALYPPDSPLLQKNALAAYDVSHARPWGWQVPAYCWTKVDRLGRAGDSGDSRCCLGVWEQIACAISSLASDCTDLHRAHDGAAGLGSRAQGAIPARRLHAAEQIVAGARSLHPHRVQRHLRACSGSLRCWDCPPSLTCLLWPTVLVGFLRLSIRHFLFGQCEGRDLWQTPLLPVHLIVQALHVWRGCAGAVARRRSAARCGTLAVAKIVARWSLFTLHLLIMRGRIHDAAHHR